MKIYPFHEVAQTAQDKLMHGAKAVHQQFNCEHCGVKQTIDEPNKFFTSGRCEECGKVTDLEKNGCNYLVIY